MSSALLAWSSLIFGAVQVPAFFAIVRQLWPFLRRNKPSLLIARGVPLFISEVVILILLPVAAFAALLSSSLGAHAALFVRPWFNGLSLGLAASVAYYGSKDFQKRLKKRSHPLPKVRDDA